MKKLFLVVVLVIIALIIMASCHGYNEKNDAVLLERIAPVELSENDFTQSYYIFPNSDKEIVSIEDLYVMHDFTLRLAKNEIFARKGYAFKNEYLHQYFINMPWYKENSDIKGTFEELNEIEQKNVTLIDDCINLVRDYEFYADMYDMYEKSEINGENCYIQSVNIDLDGDGILENVQIYFYTEDYYMSDRCEIVITDAGGGIYITEFADRNIIPSLKFAEFNILDNLLQFYIMAAGSSGDPNTQIYSFDGKQIIENTRMIGYITRYDGMSKLYSFDEYSVNCYYDLNNGITPLPKENIVGTTITRGNIQLFKNPFTEPTINIISSYLTDPEYKYEGKYLDDYIGVVPEGTPLLVTDIVFEKELESNEFYPVPWIKVKTPQNIEGWFCLIYGD